MSTAKIYKLECLQNPHIFINVTTKRYLSERLTFYRSEYKRYLKAKLDENEYKKYINIKRSILTKYRKPIKKILELNHKNKAHK